MRRSSRATVALLALALGSAFAIPALGQVSASRHDFSGEPAGSAQTGVCTFCHTPHKGWESRLAWNHTLSTNTHFWNDATTGDGTPFPTIDPSWQGPTKFCLSCHDGSVAIGDIAWFNGRMWTGGSAIDDQTHDGDNVQIGNRNGNLTGQHPMAHPIPFGGVASSYNGVTSSAAAVLSGWLGDPTVQGIRLFHETGSTVVAGGQTGTSGIECSSCHDPHNGSGVEDDPLLRGSTDARDPNYICEKCHLSMFDYLDVGYEPHPRQ